MFTVERLKSAAAVIVSTRADEPFFRGDEPERSPSPHRRRFAEVCGGTDATDMLKTRYSTVKARYINPPRRSS